MGKFKKGTSKHSNLMTVLRPEQKQALHKHRAVRKFFAGAVLALSMASCGDDGERKEVVNKLRALGVEQSPVIATPGGAVQLTFFLAGPKGMILTPKVYLDTAIRYGTSADVSLVDTTPTEEPLGVLSLYKLRAQFTAPSDTSTLGAIALKGNALSRYGVHFQGIEDEETIIGDTLVYSPTSAFVSWKDPAISIAEPVLTTIGTTTILLATVNNPNEETSKVSWFSSSGKIKNPNSKSTEWSEVSAGDQLLILTVRGRKSGSFAIKTARVKVQ
ncbi:MAG: hypothetical protein NTV34_18120 [Proteobacteria bacterium]|nr:hypothetical protein [Pseudomonadota bacterium]